MFLGQSTGPFVLVSYAASIFQLSGSSLSPNMSAILIGITCYFGSYFSMLLADRKGRKFLLLSSLFFASLGYLFFGGYLHLKHYGIDLPQFEWFPIFCVCFTILALSFGITNQPFVVISEISPTQVKLLINLATSVLYYLNFSA